MSFWDNIVIMEKKMETTIGLRVIWGYIGVFFFHYQGLGFRVPYWSSMEIMETWKLP